MLEMFVDSSAFFALGDPDGPRGNEVHRLLQSWQKQLITTDLIFAETISLVTKRIGKHTGIAVGETLLSSSATRIIPLDEQVKKEAWSLFKKYKDKDFDFIDATSFVVCRQRGIKEVITLDRHFAQMEFKVHP